MATRLVLNHWQDWLEPGSASDTRLHHAEESDRILVCPSELGQGYMQEIPLQDDLSLHIHDYTLHDDLILDSPGQRNRSEFDFVVKSHNTGSGFFLPCFGVKTFHFQAAQKKVFKLKVAFKHSASTAYCQAFMERLSPQTYSLGEQVIQAIYRHQEGHLLSSAADMLAHVMKQIMPAGEPPPRRFKLHVMFEELLNESLYSAVVDVSYAARCSMTSAMQQVIGAILSCPYRRSHRRTYLTEKALQLVALYLESMLCPYLSDYDLSCIHRAAAILRQQFANPPTVDALARQVGTNRLKLNQGFHQVYGTTPFSYLRQHRMRQAQRLLMLSDVSVVEVAAAVGYRHRSRFAQAFRKYVGVNPKTFQMELSQIRRLGYTS
ncbi:MAG: AraC family transcriptional regulator [Cyanobacteria bacterium P01_B01_bin.77]